jgi:hypothetical protein
LPADVAAGITDTALADRLLDIAPLVWTVSGEPTRQESVKAGRSSVEIELTSELRVSLVITPPGISCPTYAARPLVQCVGGAGGVSNSPGYEPADWSSCGGSGGSGGSGGQVCDGTFMDSLRGNIIMTGYKAAPGGSTRIERSAVRTDVDVVVFVGGGIVCGSLYTSSDSGTVTTSKYITGIRRRIEELAPIFNGRCGGVSAIKFYATFSDGTDLPLAAYGSFASPDAQDILTKVDFTVNFVPLTGTPGDPGTTVDVTKECVDGTNYTPV